MANEIDLSGKVITIDIATICIGPVYKKDRIAQVPVDELLGGACPVTLRVVVEQGKIEDYP